MTRREWMARAGRILLFMPVLTTVLSKPGIAERARTWYMNARAGDPAVLTVEKVSRVAQRFTEGDWIETAWTPTLRRGAEVVRLNSIIFGRYRHWPEHDARSGMELLGRFHAQRLWGVGIVSD